MKRRSFLKLISLSTLFIGLNLLSGVKRKVKFNHGVASGDPTNSNVILWTRLTVNNNEKILTTYEVSDTKGFKNIIASGKRYTDRNKDFTVKVDVLIPRNFRGKQIFYRFKAEGVSSKIGATTTLPQNASHFKVAIFSCSNYPAGFFNAYNAASKDNSINMGIHVGDYLYEYKQGEYATENAVQLNRQPIPNKEITSLDDYRLRHAQYKSDEDLQALHSSIPMACAWDDHEIANDAWREGAENHQINEGSFAIRKRNALKAYFEWMPVREPESQSKNWKRYKVGNLVDIKLLETRLSSRSKQLEIDNYITKEGAFLEEDFYKALRNKKRKLLGNEQLNFVKENIGSNQSWNVYAQQVLLASLKLPAIPSAIIDMLPDYQQYFKTVIKEELPYNLDAWDGYPAEREKFLKLVNAASNKSLFIAGDTHNCWANNIMLDDKFVGAELATPSVSSPGASENFNGMISSKDLENAMTLKNKNLKWPNLADRGYLTINFKPEIATAEFIAVDTISSRNYKTKILKRIEITPGQELT